LLGAPIIDHFWQKVEKGEEKKEEGYLHSAARQCVEGTEFLRILLVC